MRRSPETRPQYASTTMAFDSTSEESRGVYVAISPQDEVSSQSDTIGHDSSVLGESRSDVRTGHLEGESSEKSEKTESHDFPRESQELRNTNPPSAKLHRSGYILCLVVLYVGLAIFAWVVTCYLTFRPITTSHYDLRAGDNSNYNPSESSDPNPLFTRNERWYHAARIIQSIVTVSTIPLTSAVCSSAAVVFIQQRSTKGISMRQVMTPADKGWTDLSIYAKTLAFFADDGWKHFGSSFLLLAILVNLLGSVISPLQQLFLSTQTIKIPTEPSWVSNVLDIPDQFSRPSDKDSNLVVAMTRSELTSTTLLERQAQLWQGGNVTCNYKYDPNESKTKLPSSCVYGGATLTNYSELAEPFLAELPSGYNTGLYSQYIPRINSTARYETISKDEFPRGCDKIDGAFFVDYFNATHGDPYWWGLQACMPMNLKDSPWKSTRDRQDFTEEIYLNVTVSERQQSGSHFYKLMLNTTAGYFELPNYMNGNVAGPLLDKGSQQCLRRKLRDGVE